MYGLWRSTGKTWPLVYTSPSLKYAKYYPLALVDNNKLPCGEVVALDTWYLRPYLTCGVNVEKRKINTRTGSNKQYAYCADDVWVTAITLCAFDTAPDEQLRDHHSDKNSPSSSSAFDCDPDPWEPCGVWRSPSRDMEEHDVEQPASSASASSHTTAQQEGPERAEFEGGELLMRLRRHQDDHTSTITLSQGILELLSIREAFLRKLKISQETRLCKWLGKSIWNEDLKDIFLHEMNDHDDSQLNKKKRRESIHGRFHAWLHLAFGKRSTVQSILDGGLSPDVVDYLRSLVM